MSAQQSEQKPGTKRKLPYEEFAEKFIEGLKNNDCVLTRRWKPGELTMPVNAVTDRQYQGVNAVRLLSEGLADPRFCTLKQANDKGWRVRKGEKGRPVFFWSFTKVERDEKGEPVRDEQGKPKLVEAERPLCRVAYVFHASQLEGDISPYKPKEISWNPDQRVETILTNSGVSVKNVQRDRAFYRIGTDEVQLPDKGQFADAGAYYSTALHELCHATRHPSRLNRESGAYGSPEYAREELRAEIASFMLGVELGVGFAPEQHQAYVNDWIRALKDDPYEIVRACRDAEKIKEYVMGWEREKAAALNHEAEDMEQGIAAFGASPVEDKSAVLEAETRQIAQDNVYLAVPYQERQRAKALGAKWDRAQKSWYAPTGTDLAMFARWRIEAPQKPTPAMSPEEEFAQRLKDAGLALDGLPVMDGQMHRVPIEGRPGARDGAYRGNLDGRPAGWFQNFVTGESDKWVYSGHRLNQEQVTALKAEAAQKQQEAEAVRQEQYDQAAKRSYAKWKHAAGWADPLTQPYLNKKAVPAFGVKVDDQDNLLIPLRDVNGFIHSMQLITPDGEKRFERGGKKAGHFHVIDPEKAFGQGPILIAEGYATAATVHLATGRPVVCAFDSGNLLPVAQALREKYPDTLMVFMADNDLHVSGNPGLTKAKLAADAVDGMVYAPTFTQEETARKLSDWNDLYHSQGLEGIDRQLYQPGTHKAVPPLYQAQAPVKEKTEVREKPAVTRGREI